MKKVISLLLCSIMALGISLMPATFENEATTITTYEKTLDTSNAIPNYDPREALGSDVLKILEEASPDARVNYNGATGTITVNEPSISATKTAMEIEPNIPEGLDVAIPSISERSVVGGNGTGDQRIQITNVNAYPYCAVAYLEITYDDNATGTASGAFVGSTTILTAGHVVYDQDHGWAKSITVYPGGLNSSFSSSTTSSVASVNGWVNDADPGYDYGIITISSSLGTGNFGTHSLSNADLSGADIYNYGYPGDKTAGTLWYCAGDVGTVYTRRFLHSADTYYGNSGGPVVKQNDYTYIIGVHSSQYNANYNAATRITSSVVSFVQDYLE